MVALATAATAVPAISDAPAAAGADVVELPLLPPPQPARSVAKTKNSKRENNTCPQIERMVNLHQK
jgi:hypothetical protein